MCALGGSYSFALDVMRSIQRPPSMGIVLVVPSGYADTNSLSLYPVSHIPQSTTQPIPSPLSTTPFLIHPFLTGLPHRTRHAQPRPPQGHLRQIPLRPLHLHRRHLLPTRPGPQRPLRPDPTSLRRTLPRRKVRPARPVQLRRLGGCGALHPRPRTQLGQTHRLPGHVQLHHAQHRTGVGALLQEVWAGHRRVQPAGRRPVFREDQEQRCTPGGWTVFNDECAAGGHVPEAVLQGRDV